MSQISPRDAVLELGLQLKNAFKSLSPDPTSSLQQATAPPNVQEELVKNDDAVSLSTEAQSKSKQVEITALKREIGNERNYIQQVITNKLSEYGLPANTALTIQTSVSGGIVAQGAVVNSKLERISFDLNQDQNFVNAYRSVSKQHPTLEYADNVSKLSQAYGQSNQVFESLISEQDEFNRLRDLTLRFQSLQSQADSSQA
ncbi:hypothetical protein A3765_12270 [Oleiphilus sp. HI0130]|jgi:hypothetical protein|nr:MULTISPECIES: hypothetical protein [unclassified Oleiphilus]KZY62598.1 hypothetical protein A3737_14935 [Oleiphilus sp. HI0065]KZZ40891.1 hypothetical protein A3758_09290 [Oleiphilus sp. HI0118]KZZ50814.1 hypothetical protein A3760_13290 [Oleiphilus sp. HI0122]KZZ73702.1 hypothetical protein A3765_12270 [Oleiphilus sp. HI0130]KZZ14304.1 hypothetical protein A3750_14870 [Oleiphilus sp. HI0079]